MDETISLLEFLNDPLTIDKPIRLIELFAGYGSQALALKYLDIQFEHWKIAEWNYKSFDAYNRIHFGDKTDYSDGKTKEWLIDYLAKKNISADWNKPMKPEQIKRMPEHQIRKIYNDIQATHNQVDISQIRASDLEINDSRYCYIMTYSFPCQDLSLAGNTAGMAKGSGTRSGLLWEVERILNECDKKPDILLMENVTQVHGAANMIHFREWMISLEKMGYQNYWQDMIGTDYGIPQIRDRTFMVSLLGDKYYNFPKPIPLEKKLKDVLETEVDDKYFISNKGIKYITDEKRNQGVVVKMPEVVAGIGEKKSNNGTQYYMQDRIYQGDAAVTIPADKGYQPYYAVAQRKRENGQQIEVSNRETANAITTVQKDSMVGARVVGNLSGGKWDKTYEQSRRVYDIEQVSPSICTHGGGNQEEKFLTNDLRIRKLTPTECFRLMGLKDDDIAKLNGISDSVKYHLAGDSIITTCLMAIFGEMLNVDWRQKVKEIIDGWN